MRIVTGVSDKPGCMQMNDARAKDLIDCTQVSRARNQPNPLIREQGKGGSIRDRLRGKGEQRSSGITSQWALSCVDLYKPFDYENETKQSCWGPGDHLGSSYLIKRSLADAESRRTKEDTRISGSDKRDLKTCPHYLN